MNKQVIVIGSGNSMKVLASIKAMARPLQLSVRAEANKAYIEIDGDIERWDNSAKTFKREISNLLAQGINDAHVYINSGGGDVFEANQIVNEIKRFTGTITGEGGAVVASAATYIAVNLDSFTLAENGMFMIHKPYGGMFGTADEVEAQIKLLRDLEASYLVKYAEKTGLNETDIKAQWDKGDWWMTAKEAKDKGFITGITGQTEITEEEATLLTARGVPNIAATVKQPKPTPTPSISNQTDKMKELQILALQLGLSENATLEEVKAAIAKLKVSAASAVSIQAKLDAREASDRTAKATASAARFKTAFDAKVADKSITESYRAGYESKWNTDETACQAELDALKPVANLTSITSGGGEGKETDERKDWTYADYSAKDSKGLHAMMKSNPDKFKALYKAEYGQEAPSNLFEE